MDIQNPAPFTRIRARRYGTKTARPFVIERVAYVDPSVAESQRVVAFYAYDPRNYARGCRAKFMVFDANSIREIK